MAVKPDTAHRAIGLFGPDPYGTMTDGFTSGNYAGGILPTELSSDWCNGVQQELNEAIQTGLGYALDFSDHSTLAISTENQIVTRNPRWNFAPVYSMRTQSNDALSVSGQLCVRYQKTLHSPSLAAGSSSNNVLVFAVPTNTQNMVLFRATSTQSDLITNYSNVEWRASVRNSGGVVTIQNSVASYSDISLAGLTYSVVVVGANVVLRLAVPAAPAGKVQNCFSYGEMICVKTTP